MATVENIHQKILQKFAAVLNCIEIIRNVSTAKSDSLLRFEQEELEKIEEKYCLSISDILNEYYKSKQPELKVAADYRRVVNADGILCKIDELADRCRLFAQLKKINCEELNNVIQLLSNTKITLGESTHDYEMCHKCKIKMNVVPASSELECDNCGHRELLYGIVFEDYQFYNQEGQKTKHGSYIPSRHFKFWMERIQAKETIMFPSKCLDEIKYVIRRDGLIPAEIDCVRVRSILKERKLTEYNDHAPLLVKMFAGVAPPQLNFNEMRAFSIRFNRIMDLYADVKTKMEGNRPYYPYFIYKIAEDLFKNDKEKIKILNFIHLQSPTTVAKNDRIYKEICEKSGDEFKFKPTNIAARRKK